jgi:hypothetical protein
MLRQRSPGRLSVLSLELGDRLAGNFNFDRAATAGCSHRLGHGLVSDQGARAVPSWLGCPWTSPAMTVEGIEMSI